MRRLVLALLATTVGITLPAVASADTVFLRGGGRIAGRIVEQTAASVEVDIGAGRVTVPMSSVDRIEKGRSPLDEYDDRARALLPGDATGWLALAQWASAQGLVTQARHAYDRVLAVAPDNPDANRALGRVELDGRWMTEDDAYRVQGYVKFEGEWVTPAEQDAILRERAAEADAQRAQVESDARVREAGARAQEAEAAARAAEQTVIPIWWGGWESGTIVWPIPPWVQPVPPVARPPHHPHHRPTTRPARVPPAPK